MIGLYEMRHGTSAGALAAHGGGPKESMCPDSGATYFSGFISARVSADARTCKPIWRSSTPKLATCFVSSPSTSSIPVNRAAWLQHIDRGYVLGFIVSPPCESWSRARLHGGVAGWSKGDGGLRVVRTEEAPEGLFAMTAPEQQQVLLANRLLCFIMLAFVLLLRISRFAVVEHPASSAAASEAWLASIWKLFLTEVFQANEFVWKVDIYQGLFGAKSPKPTSLLFSVGPSIDVRAILEKGQTVEEMPRQLEMGWDRQAGEYQTASLKNYPGGLCAAISCVCQQWLECYLPEVPPSDADPLYSSSISKFVHFTENLERRFNFSAQRGSDYHR